MQSVKKRKRVQSAFEWMDALVSAVIIVVLLFTFLFRTIGVEGTSMVPTLANGDRLIVSHLFYRPTPGDVVVIVQPESDTPAIIKRIIAVEGQTVDIISAFWNGYCGWAGAGGRLYQRTDLYEERRGFSGYSAARMCFLSWEITEIVLRQPDSSIEW